MGRHCATCTCTCPRFLSEDELLDILTNGEPHREVYRGNRNSGWFVTYGGGETTERAVRGLISRGRIHSVYSTCPDEAYHVGRTIDMKRSKFAGKNPITVYVNGD